MTTEKTLLGRFRAVLRFAAPVLAFLLFGSSNPDPYPKDYFRSPLGIPLVLAGSFAEMRSNHFHSGLDLKTNGRSGYRIYAAADGWVSRISVSPGGFGNALYVTHANGFMTVYAHLNRFSEPLAEYVQNMQYARESFRVDAFPTKGRFPVSQGEVIAFSGNSGSSSGPHLHFEIRNAETGWPVNPLLFDLDIPDTRRPRIRRIKLYAMGENSRIRIRDTRTGGWRNVRGNDAVLLDVSLVGDVYQFARADLIEATGEVGFGIQTYDYHNGSSSRLGAYRIALEVDGSFIFTSQMERFSFNVTRHVNAHVDYGEYIRNRRWIQRSYILPGNKLPIYEAVERGILHIEPDQRYEVQYRISDVYGNESVLPFSIRGFAQTDTSRSKSDRDTPDFFVEYDKPFVLKKPGITIRMPANTVYDDTNLIFEQRSSSSSNHYSPVYRIHDRETPVQEPYVISIDANDVPERLQSKTAIGRLSRNGRLSYAGGSYRDGRVTASVRSFGDYTIAADTVAPSIRAINISRGKNMARSSNIRFRIGDNFSGIGRYTATIDNKWVLFAYDAKTRMLRHTFDGRIQSGTHDLRLEVEDLMGNVRVYETTFIR